MPFDLNTFLSNMLGGGLLSKGRDGGKYRDLRRKKEVMGEGASRYIGFFFGGGKIRYK